MIENAPNYRFERINICDFASLEECFQKHDIDAVIHLAAESHVDRSITGPAEFVNTNIIGTFNLLELARRSHGRAGDSGFTMSPPTKCSVRSARPGTSPKKAGTAPIHRTRHRKPRADHLVRAYHKTYGLNVVTTNCSNNYGPYQFPEKLIPLMIRNAAHDIPLPVYGDGRNVRDWLYVEDHCEAIDLVFHKGQARQDVQHRRAQRNREYPDRASTLHISMGMVGGEPRRNA